jgi:hypothetical protein
VVADRPVGDVSGLATTVYRAVAMLVARRLGALEGVRGVYARRSVAAGEVALGQSDIDLTILTAPTAGLDAEAAALETLATRFASIRWLVRKLGTCEIGTRAELEEWYRTPWFPASAFRDRGWLRLHGEPFVPPPVVPPEAARSMHLRWMLWAWETLPRFHREGNARTCANLLLDIVNVGYLHAGSLDVPATRAELLERWRREEPNHRLPDRLRPALFGSRRVHDPALCRAIYTESARRCDAIAATVAPDAGGRIEEHDLTVAVPFSFAPRRYLVAEPAAGADFERALDVMEGDPRALATSERTLRLHWAHRNPWEYFTSLAASVRRTVGPPSAAALRAAVRYHLHRIVPRRLGLSIGRRVDRSRTLGPRYAQGRLWAEHAFVAADLGELTSRYRATFGAWPWDAAFTPATYWNDVYPRLCAEIDAITAALG